MFSHQFLVEATETEQEDIKAEMDKKVLENNQDQADGDESHSTDVGVNGSTVWTNPEISGGNDTNIFVLL